MNLHGAGGGVPARVIIQQKTHDIVTAAEVECRGALAEKLRFLTMHPAELSAAGDWVVFRPASEEQTGAIRTVLPRRSTLSRRAAARMQQEQVTAARVDVVALDETFTLRSLERYLVLAVRSGVWPVVVLNKADRCGTLEETLLGDPSECARCPSPGCQRQGECGDRCPPGLS